MPGTLVADINRNSSFNAQKDGDDLCVDIKDALSKSYPGLTVFFLAEKHRDSFDGKRSNIVLEEFSKQQYEGKLCLGVERGLYEDVKVPHVLNEGRVGELSSRDPRRNARIVSL